MNQRYTDNGDGTISDSCTGLMWVKDMSACGTMNQTDAFAYVALMTTGGYTDWRVPECRDGTVYDVPTELDTLFVQGGIWVGPYNAGPYEGAHAPFTNPIDAYYMTANTAYSALVVMNVVTGGSALTNISSAHPLLPCRGTYVPA